MSDALAGQISLAFFFLFFLGVIAWAFWPARARRLRRDSALPLDEGRLVSGSTDQERHDD